MRDTAERITYELGVLLGQPVTDCWRAADMQIFEFGPQEPFVNRKGVMTHAGRFRIHVQCHWRIIGPDKIHFARQDLFESPDPTVDPQSYDYVKQPPNLLDVKQRAWFAEHRDKPLKVISANGDRFGGCRIALEGDFVLECVAFSTGPGHEFWRMLDALNPTPHFVVTSAGVK